MSRLPSHRQPPQPRTPYQAQVPLQLRVNLVGSRWLGQDRPTVRVWILQHRNSIEETMFDLIGSKQTEADLCLRGVRRATYLQSLDWEDILAKGMERPNCTD